VGLTTEKWRERTCGAFCTTSCSFLFSRLTVSVVQSAIPTQTDTVASTYICNTSVNKTRCLNMLDAVFPQKSVMTNIMGLWFDWSKCVAHLLQTTSVENTVNTREITPTRHHVTLLVIFSSDFLNLTNISCVTLTLQQTSSWQLCPLQTSFW